MLEMFLPVGGVLLGERSIVNAHEVFCVLLLRRLGKIEAPRKDHVAVDNHDLVVCDGVLGIDPDRNSSVSQEGRRRIMSGAIAAVENNFHLDSAPIGVHERFGDGRGGKIIGLDQDALSRAGQCVHGLGSMRSCGVAPNHVNVELERAAA